MKKKELQDRLNQREEERKKKFAMIEDEGDIKAIKDDPKKKVVDSDDDPKGKSKKKDDKGKDEGVSNFAYYFKHLKI